jgi:hypothetical protein
MWWYRCIRRFWKRVGTIAESTWSKICSISCRREGYRPSPLSNINVFWNVVGLSNNLIRSNNHWLHWWINGGGSWWPRQKYHLLWSTFNREATDLYIYFPWIFSYGTCFWFDVKVSIWIWGFINLIIDLTTMVMVNVLQPLSVFLLSIRPSGKHFFDHFECQNVGTGIINGID